MSIVGTGAPSAFTESPPQKSDNGDSVNHTHLPIQTISFPPSTDGFCAVSGLAESARRKYLLYRGNDYGLTGFGLADDSVKAKRRLKRLGSCTSGRLAACANVGIG